MMQFLKSLLSDSSGNAASHGPQVNRVTGRNAAAHKAAPIARGADYRSVSLTCPGCPAAVENAATRRYLLRDAPRLPLVECTNPSGCACKFRKHPDRRDGDRRLLGDTTLERWFSGAERRNARVRRKR